MAGSTDKYAINGHGKIFTQKKILKRMNALDQVVVRELKMGSKLAYEHRKCQLKELSLLAE